MLEINSKYEGPAVEAAAVLELPFELRQKTRLRTQAKGGEDAWVMLPRGGILRGGDLLVAADGRVVAVTAKPEAIMEVRCADPLMLTKAAYHLGNRHVPVEIGEGYLRLTEDHVLEKMLEGLGVSVTRFTAPFEPEAGAYGGGHSHGGMPSGSGRIHEFVGQKHGIGGAT